MHLKPCVTVCNQLKYDNNNYKRNAKCNVLRPVFKYPPLRKQVDSCE